jgi:DNA-binding protein HU-beta
VSKNTVNKKELVAAIAATCGLAKTVCETVLDATMSAVSASLADDKEIRLVGFGTFYTAKRKATKGRNPRTGDVIDIPASNQPKFKAGKGLKDAVN